jgi:H+/Cl- antiporter ClcA
VQNAFQDIELLQTNWVFGVTGLAYLPPSIMQIFLCFLSGLFGALLLTLILIVYPNSELKSAGTASFWNRIFLGGLTAVGAFVMIGGGVAVISSSDTLFNGRSNFMSFCAIGILAGMFSDRVAKWLSRTATTMFDKQPDPPDGQSNGQTANGAAT